MLFAARKILGKLDRQQHINLSLLVEMKIELLYLLYANVSIDARLKIRKKSLRSNYADWGRLH